MLISKTLQTCSFITANIIGAGCILVAGWYDWGTLTAYGIALGGFGLTCLALPPVISHVFEVQYSAVRQRDHALSTLTALTFQCLELNDEAYDLRVTLLKVDTSSTPPRLVQVTRSTRTMQTPGTTFMTIHQGLAGRCYRHAPPSIKMEPDVENFLDYMIDLGFQEEEALKFQRDRKTYLCAPIVDAAGHVIAVLCLDAKIPNVFGDIHIGIVEMVSPFFARLLTGP
jgi:GAF domain-containing protein